MLFSAEANSEQNFFTIFVSQNTALFCPQTHPSRYLNAGGMWKFEHKLTIMHTAQTSTASELDRSTLFI